MPRNGIVDLKTVGRIFTFHLLVLGKPLNDERALPFWSDRCSADAPPNMKKFLERFPLLESFTSLHPLSDNLMVCRSSVAKRSSRRVSYNSMSCRGVYSSYSGPGSRGRAYAGIIGYSSEGSHHGTITQFPYRSDSGGCLTCLTCLRHRRELPDSSLSRHGIGSRRQRMSIRLHPFSYRLGT